MEHQPMATSRQAETLSPTATALLTEDHRQVRELFKQYEELVDSGASEQEKADLAGEICLSLTVHAIAEEELFYPSARGALGDDEDLVDEATVEHTCVKELIAQLQSVSPGQDALFDAKVKVMGEYVEHHVKEEEGEIFPKFRKAAAEQDKQLGARIAERKEALLAEAAGSPLFG
jgi:hemerythrin superfamily protein